VEKVIFSMGNIISIVGPTGCGKTTLINDIEMYASGDTPTKRVVHINDRPITDHDDLFDPSRNPVAIITQHTNFLSDLVVKEFLTIHATIRQNENPYELVHNTVHFANQLTGEPIIIENQMTELSGGQTRALLIADAVIIGNSPIILLDEIENAGINRIRALELLRDYHKIFIFVTHDPRIALLSDFRITMRNGAMQDIIMKSDEEKSVLEELIKMDDILLDYRNRIRNGESLCESDLKERLRIYGYLPAEGS
jgi:ABC-type lipoprotein export system ATPase subunit